MGYRIDIYKLLSAILPVLALIGLTGCGDMESRPDYKSDNNLRVLLSLSQYSDPSYSRAIIDNAEQDQWSYKDFSAGDEMGFYADTKNGVLLNMPMMFLAGTDATGNSTSSFGPSDNPDFDPTSIKGSNAFMYFPYSDQIPSEFPSSLPGMPLRTKTAPYSNIEDHSGPWRCIDFIVSGNLDTSSLQESGTISGNMVHSFSELIIMRGDGFDNPQLPPGVDGDPYEITVKLNKPYTHVTITTSSNPWKCSVSLVNVDGYIPSDEPDFDATEWVAWKGGNYGQTDANPAGYEAWYVILPTMGDSISAERSQVEYIQLYDNDGTLQTIKDLYLSGSKGYVHHQQGNYLDRKWRYPMQISMQELVPTVFPFTIEPWGNDNITNARTRGITQENLSDFISAYNTFISGKRATGEDNLAIYGDKILTQAGSYWHFYILESLDFSTYNSDYVIPELQDVIDGKSSPASSTVTLSQLTVPFVGQMVNGNDSLMNLTFERPYIDNPDLTIATGALVNSINGGGISNCYLNQGYINVKGQVGMFVGTMTNGKITNSKASGVIMGSNSSSSSGYLVGSSNTGNAYTGNNSTVVFSNVTNNGN